MLSEQKLVKVITAGLYLILLTPLLFHRSFMYPFVTPRTFVFHALVEIVFALWLALALFHKAYRPKVTPLTIVLFLFLLSLIISSAFGLDPQRSVWSTQDRAVGLFSLFHFVALFFILTSLPGFNWKKYLTFSFAVSTIAALFAFLVAVGILNPQFFLTGASDRPGSFLGNPTFLSAYLLFHVFIGLFLIFGRSNLHRSPKIFRRFDLLLIAAGILLNVLAIFLTQTRGAILGLVSGFLLLFVLLAFQKEQRRFRSAARFLLAGFILFSVLFWMTRSAPLWQKVPGVNRIASTTLKTSDIQPRLITWQIALKAFRERPVFGFGFENFKYPFDKHYDPRLLRSGFTETFFDKPHNVFLEYLVVGGAVGLLLYVGLFVATFYFLHRSSVREARPLIAAAFGAYIVQNNFVFDTFGSYLMFFVLLGFIEATTDARIIRHDKRHVEYGEVRHPKGGRTSKYFYPALVILLGLSFLPIYFINYRTLYANNRQYWGLNYFVNRLPEEALEAYAQALSTPNPYQDAARKDFVSALFQTHSQGVEIPNIENVSSKAMKELAKAINNHPNDHFLRVTFADASSVFYVFNPSYLKAGEEQTKQAFIVSPKRQEIFYSLAKLKVIQGKKDEALSLMKQAVELDREAADPHFYYGLVAFAAGNQQIGLQETERAAALGRKPKNAGEARVLANYYGDAEEYVKAIEFYKMALTANPEDWESKLKLGIVYFYTGKNDEARQEIQAVLQAFPDFRKSPNFEQVREIVEALGL